MERSPELEALARRVVQAMNAGHPSVLRDVLSRSAETFEFGTDAAEEEQGYEQIVALNEAQYLESARAAIPIEEAPIDAVRAYRVGTAGWAAVRCGDPSAGANERVLRTTLVFELQGVQWKVVHMHWSFGVPNEESWGQTFTTTADNLADRVAEQRPSMATATNSDGTVTLLFSDIEGSTPLLRALGDRRFKEVLQWHNGVARTALAEAGGHEVSWEGDGFMFAFGSARRALRCATHIQRNITQGDPDYPALLLRMGVHSGEVLRDQDEFFGHVVHYAARVASSAVGGQVLCSAIVRELLAGEDEWVFTAQAPKELKGFDGTHTLYEVVTRRDERS